MEFFEGRCRVAAHGQRAALDRVVARNVDRDEAGVVIVNQLPDPVVKSCGACEREHQVGFLEQSDLRRSTR
jgi:hypothetical protein